MLVDGSDPGLENLLPVAKYKVAKTGDRSNRRLLIVTSDERNPPNLISGDNTCAALG